MRYQIVKARVGHIIFETDTWGARAFDIILLCLILTSVLLVMLESVASLQAQYGALMRSVEWFFTAVFSLEYLLRVWSARKRWRYVFSFFGLIDLLSILPFYLSLFFDSSRYFLIIRALRLLRVFRVLN
ncbi:MAG: ion transporter [Deinococcales bacterium]